MNDNVRLVERLSAEHKEKAKKVEVLEKEINDSTLIAELNAAKDTFVPGRLDQGKSLQKFQDILQEIGVWMDRHFNAEESALLKSVEQSGDHKLVTGLKSLLLEHADLRNRMVQAKELTAELKSGALGHQRWNASANDLRAHISHTRKLLEAHMVMENELFDELRRHFSTADQKKKDDEMTRKIDLVVNGASINLDYFVSGYLDHVAEGILASLHDTVPLKTLKLAVTDAGVVKITLNNANIPLNYFAELIIRNTLAGVVTALKGVDGPMKTMELNISR